MKLDAELLSVSTLTADDRQSMFALMDQHYAGCNWGTFSADLAEKKGVIVLREPVTGRICGFSTQMLMDISSDGTPATALFSGDTIIDRSHWGDHALMHVWGRLALELIDDMQPNGSLYWFLISQGYKTYRFLPTFFNEFYPRFDQDTPPHLSRLVDALAQRKFASAYDAATGVVRADPLQYRLRQHLAPVTEERLANPHVRYFVQCNPGHAQGDELCCLAPLPRETFTAAAYRVIDAERPAAW